MADTLDEYGRPIQLTNEHGRPVQLTDEHGVPMHLTGVATAVGSTPHGHTTIGSELHDQMKRDETEDVTMGSETHDGTHFVPTPVDYAKHGAGAVAGAGAATVGAVAGVGKAARVLLLVGITRLMVVRWIRNKWNGQIVLALVRREEDGQGGQRKEKGIMQKIKYKLPGSHNGKEKEKAAAHSASTETKVSSTGEGLVAGIKVDQEHEKKGFMDKIKDKLPGHH